MPMRRGFLGPTPMLAISGDLDHSSGSDLVELGLEMLASGSDLLLVDLSECLYLDSGGLSALFSLLRFLRPKGSMGAIGANRSVANMIRIAGLLDDPAFRLFADRAAAVALLQECA